MLACAYFRNTFTFSTTERRRTPQHQPNKKTVSSNNCFNRMPPISIDFSATTFVSKYSTARWNNNPGKCTKSQHNLFLSTPSLHVSVSVQPQSRPANARIHVSLQRQRVQRLLTWRHGTVTHSDRSENLRQHLSPLSQTVTLPHTRPCAVPGCLAGSYRSEI